MDTIASAKPIPAPATAPVAKPSLPQAPAPAEAAAASAQPVARPRPAFRAMDYFVIALTAMAACGLLSAARSHGDAHPRELLPIAVAVSAH